MRRTPDELLQDEASRYLHVLWCDNAGVVRAKATHLPSLRDELGEVEAQRLRDSLAKCLTVTQTIQGLPVTADVPVPAAELEPIREIRLVPDWSTLRELPWAPGHIRAMANLEREGEPWALCPRHFLRRVEAAAAARGLVVRVGAEVEFVLLRAGVLRDGLPVANDSTLYAAMAAFSKSREVIDAISEGLYGQGIALENYNPESACGQHEISLRHRPALEVADQLVAARETIRAVARGFDLVASFLPKIFPDQAGSGCHVHLSLHRGDRNVTGDATGPWKLSAEARSFIAGLLEHLPALLAATTPSPNSFRRLQPSTWSGAYTAWGIDNKEAAVRVLQNPFGDGPTNFELKSMDLSANPYVALGCVLTAGGDGIVRALELRPPVQRNPASLSPQERETLGVARLPESLPAALAAFKADTALREAMGKEFARVYTVVREAEVRTFADRDLDFERRLLLERY